MELFEIMTLPLVIRTGVFYKKHTRIKKQNFSKSISYNTEFYPKKKFHKPIFF